jgi:opacity protein-like surface antigen
MKKTSSFLKLAVLAVAWIGLSASAASAQSMKASFTLPNEVRWGRATLAAGSYTITFSGSHGPALVRASTGEGRALVIPVTVSPANVDEPSGLVVAVVENRYDVLYLNLREVNLSFGYRLSKKSERKVAGTAAQPEVVAAQLAEK